MKKINVNGNEYVFINKTYKTKNGFKHVSELYVDGWRYGTATVYYLNRTWEKYEYQTCMIKLVDTLIAEAIARGKRHYLIINGYERLTKNRLADFKKMIDEDIYINELKDVLKALE